MQVRQTPVCILCKLPQSKILPAFHDNCHMRVFVGLYPPPEISAGGYRFLLLYLAHAIDPVFQKTCATVVAGFEGRIR